MKKEIYGWNTAGQAKRRETPGIARRIVCALLKNRRAAAWYGFLILTGILFYKAGAAYSLRWRGYYAVGGEVLIPLIPVLFYGLIIMIREIVRDCR